jgi:hypothetical protein
MGENPGQWKFVSSSELIEMGVPPMTGAIAPQDKVLRSAWWILTVAIMILTVAIRLRLLEIPLERDEGEYAYAGQLMLQGIPPYKLAYNMKWPGTYAAYALIMWVFGQSAAAIHLGLLLINLASVALLFFLGRRLWNPIAGLAAAGCYAVLSVSPSVLGFAAHATHFVVLPVLGGLLLLLRSDDRGGTKTLFASGLLFGIGAFMKQPGVFFVLSGLGYSVSRDLRSHLGWRKILRRNAAFTIGAAIPFAITCFLLWRAGVFRNFWFWTFDYARAYGTRISVSSGIRIFLHHIKFVIGFGWLLWACAGIGLSAFLWNVTARRRMPFVIAFLIFSTLALGAGLYFRKHYFILILPALSLLAGAAASAVRDLCAAISTKLGFVPLLLFGVALALPLAGESEFLFRLSPAAACRKAYWINPFLESVRVAEYLREHTEPNDTIAVLGSEPEIYFYSHRHSATGYIYTYGLMETQKYALQMQREMIREIELARPKYLVCVSVNYSWLMTDQSNRMIFNWMETYSRQDFTLVGLVNIFPNDSSEYYLPLVSEPPPRSPNYLLLYKRNL